MAKKKEMTDDEKQTFLTLMRKRLSSASRAEKEMRDLALIDLQMAYGDQWDSASRKARGKRPMVTINNEKGNIAQISNAMRQKKLHISVSPEGMDDNPKIAQVLEGKVKEIEHRSDADAVYDYAANMAAACGMGSFQIVTDYSDDDTFNQCISIKAIDNPFGHFIDPTSKAADFSDANWQFLTETISKAEFEERWPDSYPSNFLSFTDAEDQQFWFDSESVRIAEYWVKESVESTKVLLADGTIRMLKDGEKEPSGVKKRRKVKTHKVMQYFVSGTEILEGPIEFPSKYIPLFRTTGQRVNIQGQVLYLSVNRYSHDAQRMQNYYASTHVETVALAPKVPILMTETQLGTNKEMWDNVNEDPLPYIIFTPDPMYNNAPGRLTSGDVPQGVMTGLEFADGAMKSTSGIREAALAMSGNERTGAAIKERHGISDIGTFDYLDNLAKTVKYMGRVLVDMIPRIHDTADTMKIRNEDGSNDLVPVNQNVLPRPGPDGKLNYIPADIAPADDENVEDFDLSKGKFYVDVEVGSAYDTQRAEAARAMTEFMTALAPTGLSGLVADLAIKYSDHPSASEAAERIRSHNVSLGVIPPGPNDAPPQPKQPDPKTQIAGMKTQQHMATLDFKKQKLGVDAQLHQLDKQVELAGIHKDALNAHVGMANVQKDAAQMGMDSDSHIQQVVIGVLQELIQSGQLAVTGGGTTG